MDAKYPIITSDMVFARSTNATKEAINLGHAASAARGFYEQPQETAQLEQQPQVPAGQSPVAHILKAGW